MIALSIENLSAGKPLLFHYLIVTASANSL